MVNSWQLDPREQEEEEVSGYSDSVSGIGGIDFRRGSGSDLDISGMTRGQLRKCRTQIAALAFDSVAEVQIGFNSAGAAGKQGRRRAIGEGNEGADTWDNGALVRVCEFCVCVCV